MVVNERPLKRMKRRITADLNDFFTFPSANNSHVDVGPFRSSVRDFISNHALLPPPSSLFPHLMTWQILFRVGDDAGDDAAAHAFSSSAAAVCLDIVEEDVARSRSVYCDHCRVVGWSGHPVCGKRYHFIIKADGNSIGGYHKPCMCCGDVVHIYETKCKSCNLDASTNDVEDWVYNQLENTTHLLHGVVHSNGFGHLLRVNGREGGSRLLSGCHIMDFWDRLCKLLGVRMVSVMDVSKKYGLEYRLLHSIIKGHPWYGDWGYEFAAGSFALTRDAYKLAVETLSSLPLSIFLSQGRNPGSRIHDIILRYKSLSECELETTRDLFGFLISLVHDAHKCSSSLDDSMSKKQHASTSGVLCAWTKSDIECVEEAMFKVLRAVTGSNWVSGRNLRRAVYKVAPPELLDYCLRELGGKMAADGMLVCSRYNPGTETFEYRLEAGGVSSKGSTACTGSSISSSLSEETLLLDMRYLYESMLQPQTIVKNVPQVKRDLAISSAEKLLDCKQFVKDYKPEKMSTNDPSVIRVLCGVEFTDESEEYTPISPPPELIVLSNATVSDLKLAASKAFQDVYLILKRFQAEELLDYGGVDESTQVRQLGSAEFVRVRGRCNAKNVWSKFRMERGIEGWTVDCSCGAKDDDGERMLACDVCGVWQHTRCLGIPDSDSVPAKFVCDGCKSSVGFVAKAGGPCKDEVVANVAGDSCCFGNSFDCPS